MVLPHMYETNGNAAKNGELTKKKESSYSWVIKDAQNTKAGNVKILKEDEPDSKKYSDSWRASKSKDPKSTVVPINAPTCSHPYSNELERFASHNNIFSVPLYKP